MSLLEYYDAYTRLGLTIIPLHPKSKKPFHYSWNQGGVRDAREFFERDSNLNMGVVLGSILDVEGDSLNANQILNKLIGESPHPRYRSQKSTHHLFLNPDPSLTRFVVSEIEFRAKLHQSVLPPSQHELGVEYRWLIGSSFPIGEMPDSLLNFFHEQRKKRSKTLVKKSKIKPGHIETRCVICDEIVMMHVQRHALEVVGFKNHDERWQCKSCRKIDLREECRYIRMRFKKKLRP